MRDNITTTGGATAGTGIITPPAGPSGARRRVPVPRHWSCSPNTTSRLRKLVRQPLSQEPASVNFNHNVQTIIVGLTTGRRSVSPNY